MPELDTQDQTPDPEQTPAEEAAPDSTPTPDPTPEEPEADPKDDGEDIDSLPEWAQRTIKSLRTENGKRRTALREAEERLSKAATTEELEAARSEWQKEKDALEGQLTRERVLRQVRLPDELAERIKGTTYDEMLEDAKALAALVRKPGRGGRGGLDPSTPPKQDDEDPVEVARKVRLARRGYNY